MSFLNSLFFYNFFEALFLLYLCHIFDKRTRDTKFRVCKGFVNPKLRKFNFVKYIGYIYLISTINLGLQYIGYFAPVGPIQFTVMVAASLLGSPILFYLFIGDKHSFVLILVVTLLNSFSAILVPSMFNLLLLSYNSNPNEAFVNITIRVFQLIVIVMYMGVRRFAKFSKKNSKGLEK